MHKTLAFLSKKDSHKNHSDHVACIQRNSFDPMNAFIYRALLATEFYTKTTGTGKGRYFSKNEVEKAMQWLPEGATAECIFLEQVGLYMQNKIFILFC